MLVRIKENAEKYRDPIGRKMRADAPVLVAGLLHSRGLRQKKDPELYARWESLTIAYLKGNTGIISVRLSCTTMKNSRTYIFSYAPIPKLMPRHYITDTRQKRIS